MRTIGTFPFVSRTLPGYYSLESLVRTDRLLIVARGAPRLTITAGGKPIREYYAATGQGKAYEYMPALAKDQNAPLMEEQRK